MPDILLGLLPIGLLIAFSLFVWDGIRDQPKGNRRD